MSKNFTRMPLEESPWVHLHDHDDFVHFEEHFRGIGTKVADLLDSGDVRTSEPFINGAQQALQRYNITTRAHKATSRTTVRFSDMKESNRPVTVFLVSDASRMKAQKPVVDIIQYCFLQEMKRHPNKKRLVYFICDEATNNEIYDLEGLLTWARAAGLRLKIIFQNAPSFRRVYGKEALATLWSETEIKLFLPGQREPETLAMIEKMLGEESYVATGRSGNTETKDYCVGGTDYKEDSKPLLTADQIRRTDKGILFIRRNKPILVDLPSVASIDPFRDQLDINPYHKKIYRLPVALKITRGKNTSASNVSHFLTAPFRAFAQLFKRDTIEPAEKKQRLERRARICWTISNLINLWPAIAIALFFLSSTGPHLAISYDGRECVYLGSRGFIATDFGPDCPLLVVLNAEKWQ